MISKVQRTAAKPPNAGKGRKKGIPNKVTGDIRAMVLQALSDLGGAEYLKKQGRKRNPAPFLGLVGKCMPKDINIGANESLADLLKAAEERLAVRGRNTGA